MCRKKELESIVDKLVKTYQSVYGDQIVKIVLYGSYARGDYDSESDVDMVALVHDCSRILQEQLKQVWDVSSDLELEFGMILSPTVIPYDEYERYADVCHIIKILLRKGS